MNRAGGNGEDRRQAWRGGGAARASSGKRPERHGRWQRTRPSPSANDYDRRRLELLFKRLALSAVAVGLVITLVSVLIDWKPSVPLVIAVVSDYSAPLGPVALADEDRSLLGSLGSGRAMLSRGTAKPIDVLRGLEAVDKEQLRNAIVRGVAEARGGGPGRNSAILYVTGVGGVDRDGRACLVPSRQPVASPADADRSWLRVGDLLDDLVALEKKPRHLIVVLDACRRGYGESLGILDGGFPAAVAAEVLAEKRKGISVILSAGAGEVACATSPDSASVFAGAFSDGIEGCADADGNGRVSLRELADYLDDTVGSRALLLHGRRQTPFVVPPPSAADDVGVSWAVRQEPQPAAVAPIATEADSWIDGMWNEAERLRPRGISERPEAWAFFERLLLRAERLADGGGEARGRYLRIVREDVESLARLLSEPLLQTDSLPSLRLAETLGPQEGQRDAVWRSAVEAWRGGNPLPAAASLPPPKDRREWLARAQDAWRSAVRRVADGDVIDQEAWGEWERLVGPRPTAGPSGAPWPLELQTARLLIRWGDRDAWRREPATFGRIITLVDAALGAALPDDVRADQLVAAMLPRRDADRNRREAFDLAAVGDEISMARAAALAAQAARRYEEIDKASDTSSMAWRLLDQVRAELPWLAAWRRRLATVANASQTDRTGGDPDWQPIVDATDRLEKSLTSGGADPAARIFTTMHDALEEADRSFRAARAAYEDACGRLADPSADNATTLAEIRGVLSVPLVVGRQRERLRRRERELSASVAGEQSRESRSRQSERMSGSAQPPTTPTTAGWVRGSGGLIDPLVAAVVPDAMAVREPQSPADMAAAYAAWGQKIREALDRTDRTDRTGQAGDDADAARSRRLAILRAGLPDQGPAAVAGDTPATEQLRRRWRMRLITAANDAVDEFLAGSDRDEAEWFIEAARSSLAAAAEVTLPGPDEPSAEKVFARVDSLAAASDRWAVLDNEPDRIGGGDGTGSSPVTSMLKIAVQAGPLIPVGDAALWLSPGAPDEALTLGRADDETAAQAAARRVPLPVARTDAAGRPQTVRWRVAAASAGQLRPEERGSLDATAWFRGHRIPAFMRLVADGGGVPVVWKRREQKPARITVAGREKKHGYVSFVFDCSGSMTTARMDKGRRAMAAALDALAQTGSWDASLWLYGHRAGWTQKPPYEVEYSDLGKRQKRATLPQPEDDVEQVQRMAFVTPTQVQQVRPLLDAVRGWGETPLYLAMRSALLTDASVVPAGDFWKIIAVTDGVNRLARARAPTTARDVIEELRAVNRTRGVPVTIDVIALDLQPRDAEERTAYDELRNLVKDAKGQWRDASDLGQLSQAFRDFLGLVRWQTQQATGAALQAELGHALEVTPGDYTVRIEGQQATESRVTVEGGEILELFAVGNDRPLEHRRYDGGSEQGPRASQRGLEDPGDPNRRWFVAAHLPSREGTGRVRFPVSLQNDDAAKFSPRPAEFWAEVRPRGVSNARPFVFSDADLEPARPVPVVDLTVDAWPRDAEEAEILVWFSPRAMDPAAHIRLEELAVDDKRTFPLAQQLPGVTLETLLKKIDDTHGRLTVVERHADRRDLPRLRLRIEPSCERAEHLVDETAGSVRHVFDLPLTNGRIAAGTRLSIIGRDELKEHCVKPSAEGGRTEPLRVRLPPRE